MGLSTHFRLLWIADDACDLGVTTSSGYQLQMEKESRTSRCRDESSLEELGIAAKEYPQPKFMLDDWNIQIWRSWQDGLNCCDKRVDGRSPSKLLGSESRCKSLVIADQSCSLAIQIPHEDNPKTKYLSKFLDLQLGLDRFEACRTSSRLNLLQGPKHSVFLL